nr:uncharacterized protein LOC113829724 [Penaeus vannamei]
MMLSQLCCLQEYLALLYPVYDGRSYGRSPLFSHCKQTIWKHLETSSPELQPGSDYIRQQPLLLWHKLHPLIVITMNTSLFFLAAVAAVAADKIPDFVVPGKCPVVDEKSLFDEQIPNHPKYAGVWYEIALTNNPYQLLKQCVRNEYSFGKMDFH